jgi:hypothetical protein
VDIELAPPKHDENHVHAPGKLVLINSGLEGPGGDVLLNDGLGVERIPQVIHSYAHITLLHHVQAKDV